MDQLAHKKKVAKPLLWIGIGSMIMTFAGLTSGYLVSRSSLIASNEWQEFPLPMPFYYSTGLIFLSSILLFLALKTQKQENTSQSQLLILFTLLLGIAFAFFQMEGWKEMVNNSIFFAGAQSNTAGSWVYVLSGFHLLHLGAGLITLLVTLINSVRGKYTSGNTLGLELTSIFWHFLDILWVILFLFLLFIR